MNEARDVLAHRSHKPEDILSPIGALKRILASLEFEQRVYGKQDPRRSTIDFPRAIAIARDAIIRAEGDGEDQGDDPLDTRYYPSVEGEAE